jgi:hypothetical protein
VRELIAERVAAKTQREMHMQGAPLGYRLKGASTLLDADGNVKLQWTKTAVDNDDPGLLLECFEEVVRERLRPLPPIEAPAESLNDDLLSVYAFGDPHIGMLSWNLETGADFDLRIAESFMTKAVQRLVSLSPPSREALVVSVGDLFHSDNHGNRTTTGEHHLDVDSRLGKVFRVGLSTMTRVIEMALEKHERVHFKAVVGNHDGTLSLLFPMMVAFYYRDNPRVVVDTSPSPFMWHRFGKCLFGIVHGDKMKMADLGEIMATDRPTDWGETTHRHWLVGHIHHEVRKELRGCTVESLRTLAARDAWHHAKGYRAGRSMNVDVYHRELGFRTRHQVGVEELRDA